MVVDLQDSIRTTKWLYLLVFCAGELTVFAFSPFNIYPLTWLTPAILFYALSKVNTKKHYFFLSWVYGVGLFGTGTFWPFYSLYYFAHAPLAFAIIATLLFVIVIALLSTGVFGLLASLFRHQSLLTRLLLFYPAAWVLVEWFRGWFLTGFPWLYFGDSQIDTIFAAYAPITGVLGVSLSTVIIAGALLMVIVGSNRQRIFSILTLLFLMTTAYFLQDIHWTQKSGKPFQVSVLQSNISQTDKANPEQLEPSLNLYLEMTNKSRDSELIVWPETALFDPFYKHMDSLILPLQKSLSKKNTVLIGGFYATKNDKLENSVLAIAHDTRQIYSKRHLVPFGEYVPLLDSIRWMDQWMKLPRSNIAPGNNEGTLQIAGQIAQMSICYEDAFGAEIITSLPEASMLINLTHDGWFTGSLEPEQHMQIARMRSLETGRYMVRATTTGPSGIINEKGKLLATAPTYTRKIITHTVQPFSGSTPYVRWGNNLIISILSVILLIGIVWKRTMRCLMILLGYEYYLCKSFIHETSKKQK